MNTLMLTLLLVSADPGDLLRGAHAIAAEDARVNHAAFIATGSDRTALRYVRMRAVSALAMVDRPEVRAALVAIVDRADDDVEVRAQALHALAFLDLNLARPRLERAARSGVPAMIAVAKIPRR